MVDAETMLVWTIGSFVPGGNFLDFGNGKLSERWGEWKEILLEDRKAGPADTAAARIDIAAWLESLPKKKRRIAALLATGETTKRTAKKFHVSPGRISQTRRELQQAWQEFQGDDTSE